MDTREAGLRDQDSLIFQILIGNTLPSLSSSTCLGINKEKEDQISQLRILIDRM